MAFSPLEKFGLLCAVGIVSYVAWKIIGFFWTYAVGPAINQVNFKSKGQWALVTGSTDGIGRQYAAQLAKKGCDIVLVSRSMDKLNAAANELQQRFKVNTRVIQADFCEDDSIYERISKDIADLEIGTLVNNVGVSYAYPEYFNDIPEWDKVVNNIFKANMMAATKMTAMILPKMVERKKGVVINIGSASSTIPSPLLTVYAASKAYIEKLSEGLEMEYSNKGIIVQCVLPGFVCSNMSGIRQSTFFAPQASIFVKSALNLVGTVSHTTGYLPHAMFVNGINLVHWITGRFGVWLVTRSMENSRTRAIRKYKRQ